MWRLALRTVRARLVSYVASAVVMVAGTALLTAFAALAETGISVPGAKSLAILAWILGGWTVVIVAFGVVSTAALVIQQRERELALLRSIGAAPAQLRRSIMAETLAVATPSVVVGVAPGLALGSFLLAKVIDAGVVRGPLALAVTWVTPVAGGAVALLAAAGAGFLAGRRASTVPPMLALAEASGAPSTVVTKGKVLAGLAFLVIGIGSGLGTLAMPDGPMLAAAAGPACIGVAIGLALLSPAVLALATGLAERVPAGVGRLALRNLGARAARATGVVGPMTLLVGISTGTLYMQGTEDAAIASGRESSGAEFAAANYLVVAMIIAFCAIAVANTLIAATRHRRREFGLLRLTASTRPQVLRMVAVESAVAAGVSVVLGTVSAAATTIPYSLVKIGSVLPRGPLWMYLAIVGGTALVALAATLPPTARATAVRPVVALAA
ncbi:FtsX-like permease family protein [Amycolatopsis sp. CA-230715]|uniref:FtsX-like permease family protein n=1 Tax=Amycolatopsis sp. CA-230715 TaxID=2745196 RepID=UPI001C039927|nr:FtsX-like permease family protein [Amycolatopsis sp. CA-230715]QWF81513.1 hypothetical protein HUW46_04945 [Amycolatopsis sp. CA-230715]